MEIGPVSVNCGLYNLDKRKEMRETMDHGLHDEETGNQPRVMSLCKYNDNRTAVIIDQRSKNACMSRRLCIL